MNNSKAPRPVLLAALTLITVIFWIIFGIVRIITKPSEQEVSTETLAPLSPTLDSATLDELESRIQLSESEIGNINITPTQTEPGLEEILTQNELLLLEELAEDLTSENAETETPEATSSGQIIETQ